RRDYRGGVFCYHSAILRVYSERPRPVAFLQVYEHICKVPCISQILWILEILKQLNHAFSNSCGAKERNAFAFYESLEPAVLYCRKWKQTTPGILRLPIGQQPLAILFGLL